MLHICETPEERIAKTRESILGPDNEGQPCPELKILAEDGVCYFEGDPPLEWRTVVLAEGRPMPGRRRL